MPNKPKSEWEGKITTKKTKGFSWRIKSPNYSTITRDILMNIGLWAFSKLFLLVDMYCPDRSEDGEVRGITFTNDNDYLEYVGGFERGKNAK